MEPGERRREEREESSKKIKVESETQFPYIQEEIILRILSNLPLDSLLRSRCVSKSWRSLIGDFKSKQKVIVMSNFIEIGAQKRFTIHLIDDEASVKELSIPKPLINPRIQPKIMGSCYGLLLVCAGVDLFLWNPLTGRCNKVLSHEGLRSFRKVVSGLCYDSWTGDYKAVMVFPESGDSSAVVGSLRNKTWTEIRFPYDKQKMMSGPTVEGRLHWVVNRNYGYDCLQPRMIVSFDSQTNRFVEVPMPELKRGRLLGLGVLDGCLSTACCGHDWRSGNDVQVCAMKKYGDKTSWTSLFIMFNLSESWDDYVLVPLGSMKNGEVLFQCDTPTKRSILVYNPLHNTFRDFPMPTNSHDFDSAMFVETLVSPTSPPATTGLMKFTHRISFQGR